MKIDQVQWDRERFLIPSWEMKNERGIYGRKKIIRLQPIKNMVNTTIELMMKGLLV